jgi:hypothetical protein
MLDVIDHACCHGLGLLQTWVFEVQDICRFVYFHYEKTYKYLHFE